MSGFEDDGVGPGVQRPPHAGAGRGRGDDDDRSLPSFAPQASQGGHLGRRVDVADESDDRARLERVRIDLLGCGDMVQRQELQLGHRGVDFLSGPGVGAEDEQARLAGGAVAGARFGLRFHVRSTGGEGGHFRRKWQETPKNHPLAS